MIDLERFRNGDSEYYRELIRQHGPMVFAVAVEFAEDRDHAEDLFQDTWARVFAKRFSYVPTGPFGGWLYRLARNVGKSDFRARSTRLKLRRFLGRVSRFQDLHSTRPTPLEDLEQRESEVATGRILAELTTREHEAVRLRLVEGRSVRETAQCMGIEEPTVRSLVRNARERLRRLKGANEDGLSRH